VALIAAEKLPQPKAVVGVVDNDVANRTLFVRLTEHASGYERLLWRQAYGQLVQAEQAGWPANHRFVWASAPGAFQVAHVLPGDYATLKVHFPTSVEAYQKLISRPRLTALATVDRETHRFLSVKFQNRGV
jgi:hypothetical protein